MRIYDVSVPLTAGIPTFPGDPAIAFERWSTLNNGDPANVTMLHFGAHTGTHIDAPAHFIAGARRVEEIPVEILIGDARVVEIAEDVHSIDAAQVNDAHLDGAQRVLFKTRNSSFWKDTSNGFRTDFTYIANDGAQALVDAGVKLVGIDYLSVEEFQSGNFDTHLTLLGSGIVIIEGLDLSDLAPGDYELICLPLKIADGAGDGAPARVVLRSAS